MPFFQRGCEGSNGITEMKTLLYGYRGSEPVDLDVFADFASRFSVIALS